MGNYKSAHSGAQIDASITRALPGGEIDRLRPNRNLLDNWDFRNVINQRGQAAYTVESGFTVDRWFCMYGTVSVSAAGITIQKTAGKPYVTFSQNIERERLVAGKTYTLSCIYQGRVISVSGKIDETGYGIATAGFTDNPVDRMEVSYNSNGLYYTVRFVFVTESPITIAAVKLELGSVSTLANDPPANYGAELAKSQRYFEVIDIPVNANIPAVMHFGNLSLCAFSIPFKVTKRTNPTITFLDGIGGRFVNQKTVSAITSHVIVSSTPYSCGISSGFAAFAEPVSGWVDMLGRIAVSADL